MFGMRRLVSVLDEKTGISLGMRRCVCLRMRRLASVLGWEGWCHVLGYESYCQSQNKEVGVSLGMRRIVYSWNEEAGIFVLEYLMIESG